MSNTIKEVRVGFVGYGGIGRVHAMGFRSIPLHYGLPADTIRVVGVATTRKESAEQAAKELGCDDFYTDYRQLIARDDVDVINCITPNASHCEVVCAAAEAGKHVYCEKPLSLTVAEGQKMVAAVESAGVGNQMTFNFRFFPALMRAHQIMKEGKLGRIFSFHGRYFRASYISNEKPLSWRLLKESGGGALTDIGSHVIDIAHYLLGPLDSIYATLETLIKERPKSAGSKERGNVEVDDLCLLQMRLPEGGMGTLEISRMGTGSANDIRFEVYGSKGALRFSAEAPNHLEYYSTEDSNAPIGGERGFRKIETYQRYEGQRAPDWTMPASFVRTHAECQYQFLRSISEGRPASPSLADGLAVQEVMDVAGQSAEENAWIPVRYTSR